MEAIEHIDPDNDRRHTNRRGWLNAKRAFGEQTALAEAMRDLEAVVVGNGWIRLTLQYIIQAYVAASPEKRDQMLRAGITADAGPSSAVAGKIGSIPDKSDTKKAAEPAAPTNWRIG